ncbi:hypothetical protein HPB50_013773 [Hyalomma asiaticum]|uniref:Uncharacterized protein n=1 Tax=Hyalomma asiaticum TaxID=266040 RepID=A0ACB7THU7_HYAAI|nr:hypothetical protein HPB50_013773 [Hyalomma asiaticum]
MPLLTGLWSKSPGMKALVLALLVSIVAAALAVDEEPPVTIEWPPRPRACGERETWKECVSSSCAEATCTRPQVGPQCTADCRYGCYCADGFYRNARQICVTRDKCP